MLRKICHKKLNKERRKAKVLMNQNYDNLLNKLLMV